MSRGALWLSCRTLPRPCVSQLWRSPGGEPSPAAPSSLPSGSHLPLQHSLSSSSAHTVAAERVGALQPGGAPSCRSGLSTSYVSGAGASEGLLPMSVAQAQWFEPGSGGRPAVVLGPPTRSSVVTMGRSLPEPHFTPQ